MQHMTMWGRTLPAWYFIIPLCPLTEELDNFWDRSWMHLRGAFFDDQEIYFPNSAIATGSGFDNNSRWPLIALNLNVFEKYHISIL